MCEQCFVKPLHWREALEGWDLIQAKEDGRLMKAGWWGLVESNDPAFIWPCDPQRDPTDGLSDIDQEAIYIARATEMRLYEAQLAEFRLSLKSDPTTSWRLVQSCIKAGYEPGKQELASWLFSYLGQHIIENQGIID